MLYTNIVNSYVNVNNVNMKDDKKSNKSINMSFRCTEEVGNKVETWAAEEDRSISNYLNRIVEKHVQDKETKE